MITGINIILVLKNNFKFCFIIFTHPISCKYGSYKEIINPLVYFFSSPSTIISSRMRVRSPAVIIPSLYFLFKLLISSGNNLSQKETFFSVSVFSVT